MIKAAGILYITDDGQALFLQRAAGGDHAGEWCIPGGKLEDGETPLDAAKRETQEEAGSKAKIDGDAVTLCRRISGRGPTNVPMPEGVPDTMILDSQEVDFTTFAMSIRKPFDVELCDENTAFVWADIKTPPEPLHPGVRAAIDRLFANELDIARMIAMGDLTSPQRYHNVTLFKLRITGSGASFRDTINEYVYRPPENYLSEDFLQRCNGLPVVWKHPDGATLTSKEFADRVVGTVFLPYIDGTDVWAVAKIFDDDAIKMMEEEQLSTSPTVVIFDHDSTKLKMEDGATLLIEGKAALLDHVAVCPRGVWDKGNEPVGVTTDNRRADEMAGENNEILEMLRGISTDTKALAKRMDSMEEKEKERDDKAKKDAEDELTRAAEEKKADAARKDAEEAEKRKDAEEAEAKKKADEETAEKKANEAANEPGAGDPDEVARKAKEDRARKDAEDEEKRKQDAARADAATAENKELKERLAKIEGTLGGLQLSDADHAIQSQSQARADSFYSLFSQSAPRPLAGETNIAYRRRLVSGLQKHSEKWKDIDISTFAGNEAAFSNVEGQIYADAAEVARNPIDLAEGELREIKTPDVTGRVTSTFVGKPGSWMKSFACRPRTVAGIRNSNQNH